MDHAGRTPPRLRARLVLVLVLAGACSSLKDPSALPLQADDGGTAGRGGASGGGTSSVAGQVNAEAGEMSSGAAGSMHDDDGGAGFGRGGFGGHAEGGLGGAALADAGAGGQGGEGGEQQGPDCRDAIAPTIKFHACACLPDAAVGCVAGDDDTGTGSIEQPFATYDKLRSLFPQLKPGEAVAFCRGGSFSAEADRYWNNPSCSADEPCVITDYEAPWADGTEAAPIIAAGDGAGFAFRNDALEPVLGFRLQNVDVRGITTGIGVYVQGAFADLSLCGLELSGMRFGVNVVGDNERLRLSGSHIHDLAGSAFLVGGGTCNDCSIEDNVIADVSRVSASVPPPDDAIVFWGGPHLRSRIVGNHFPRYGQNEQGACSRGAITVHGPHEDLLVASNTMAAPFDEVAAACGGVLVNTQATRSVVRGNRFTDLGHVALRVMDCEDCIVENNVVESGRALQDVFGIDVQYSSGTKVRNNTVHFDGLGRAAAFAFHELSGGVLANNLIVNSAAAPEFDCFLGLKADAQIFDFFDNNGCWFPKVVDAEWAGGIGSLTQWRTQSLPATPDQSSFNADPGLGADLRPLPGAYLVGRGNAAHAAHVDFDGDERHTPPDVGAFEH